MFLNSHLNECHVFLNHNRPNDTIVTTGSSNVGYVSDTTRNTPMNVYSVDNNKRGNYTEGSAAPLYAYAECTPRAITNKKISGSSQYAEPTSSVSNEEIIKVSKSPENPVYFQLEKPTDRNNERQNGGAEGPLYFQLEKDGSERTGTGSNVNGQAYDRTRSHCQLC